MSAPKIDLIRQALSAAESSIKLARQLLSDVEVEEGKGRTKPRELPGVAGMFDGLGMVTEKGERFPVPENYASKSILVVGDTLKLVGEGGEKRFKQIEHVKRHKTTGILTKKDGKWAVVTPEGSYRVLDASVGHFDGAIGDEVLLQIPANNLQTTWAAVENITKKGEREGIKAVPAAPLREVSKPEARERPEAVEKAETKSEEGKEKIATTEAQKKEETRKKEKEEKPKESRESPKVEAREEKPKPPVPHAAKPIPAESKPPVAEIRPAQAAPKPAPVEEAKIAPAESKPVPAQPKPTTGEVAEDELR